MVDPIWGSSIFYFGLLQLKIDNKIKKYLIGQSVKLSESIGRTMLSSLHHINYGWIPLSKIGRNSGDADNIYAFSQ
jgi:hypothetical protein